MDFQMNQNVTELNVGGQLVSTLTSTLKKEGNILEQKSYDKNGRLFIDCDFDVFKHVLDFLRNENNLPTPEMALKVYELSKNIECETLVKKLESYHTVKYRKQMEDINKREGEGYRYISLKETAIERIERLYVGPGEDKALHFIQHEVNTCCLPFKDGEGFPFRDVIIYANALLYVPDVGDEMLALLAFDLCKLGYGKYAITNKYNNQKHCKSCNSWFNCKQIILLTH